MLSAGEVPRIAGTFGLDTTTRANIMSAVYTAHDPGLHQLGQAPDGGEVLDDLPPHLPDAGAQARDLSRKLPLERH